MLSGEKILLTGPAGRIASHWAAALAPDNDVWGVARFSEEGSRERIEALGVTTRAVDLTSGDYTELPDDFTVVLHLAAFQLPDLDYDWAMKVNAEVNGLLMQHCQDARFLITSTIAIYDLLPDLQHVFHENDPLGDSRQPYSPAYAVTKIAGEGVARTCARLFDVPTTLARVAVTFGGGGGLPEYQLDAIMAGEPVYVPPGGVALFNPISFDDMLAQIPALLDAASVPATIVNWGGRDIVSVKEWCAYLGELVGKDVDFVETPDAIPSRPVDVGRLNAIAGPSPTDWKVGMRRMVEARYPDLVLADVD